MSTSDYHRDIFGGCICPYPQSCADMRSGCCTNVVRGPNWSIWTDCCCPLLGAEVRKIRHWHISLFVTVHSYPLALGSNWGQPTLAR
jgi:hypothetical protein